jgi:hypothetical protein
MQRGTCDAVRTIRTSVGDSGANRLSYFGVNDDASAQPRHLAVLFARYVMNSVVQLSDTRKLGGHGRCSSPADVAEFPAGFGHNRAVPSVTSARRVSKDGGVRAEMATDYDSPRKTDDDVTEDSLQELQARRMDKSSTAIDIDPDDIAESLELPGADLSNEELSFRVIPRQADEFTCSSCFLVHHRSQLADNRSGQPVCRECAA